MSEQIPAVDLAPGAEVPLVATDIDAVDQFETSRRNLLALLDVLTLASWSDQQLNKGTLTCLAALMEASALAMASSFRTLRGLPSKKAAAILEAQENGHV